MPLLSFWFLLTYGLRFAFPRWILLGSVLRTVVVDLILLRRVRHRSGWITLALLLFLICFSFSFVTHNFPFNTSVTWRPTSCVIPQDKWLQGEAEREINARERCVVQVIHAVYLDNINVLRVEPVAGPRVNESERIATVLETVIAVVGLVTRNECRWPKLALNLSAGMRPPPLLPARCCGCAFCSAGAALSSCFALFSGLALLSCLALFSSG